MNEAQKNHDQHSPVGSQSPAGLRRATIFGAAVGAIVSLALILLVLLFGLPFGVPVQPDGRVHLFRGVPDSDVAVRLVAIWGGFGCTIGAVVGRERRRRKMRLMQYTEESEARRIESWSNRFSAVPKRPFENRLKRFTGQVDADSIQSPAGQAPRPSKMPFFFAVTLGRPFRPKSAAYIREILHRIRLALRGSLE